MKQSKTVIAITGGIGSGKSMVRSLLETQGYTCFDCDRINANLLETKEYLEGLFQRFPHCFENGILIKSLLRQEIFRSEESRRKLNTYAHRAIKNALMHKIKDPPTQLIFVEVPVLNDTDDDFIDLFDEIWVVTCDTEKRAERVILRDNISIDQVHAVIHSQARERVYPKPTVYIPNEGTIVSLEKKLSKEIDRIKKGA